MKITGRWDKSISAILFGLADIGTEMLDAKQNWTQPFKNSTDWLRTAAFAGSAIANIMDIETEVSEALFYASMPLFFKSVKKLVQPYLTKTSTTRSYVPSSPQSPVAFTPAPTRESAVLGVD